MKVKIEFLCDNAAFEGQNCGPEIARLLRKLADQAEGLQYDSDELYWQLPLFDINGNKVGTFQVTE